MRVVLDTNVLISGIFWGGPPFEILKLWRDGKVSFVVSPEILEEYRRVGFELVKKNEHIDIGPILNLIVTSSEIYAPKSFPEPVCRDPDDDKFLECALSSGVDFIISGDKDLLELSTYGKIKIITPRDFLQLMKKVGLES